jgi:hypothetical protein
MPDVKWVEPADNPWGVPVLDVRPVTLTMLSMSENPRCAKHLGSYGQDDGRGFLGKPTPVARTLMTNLRFQRDRLLADGAIFIPQVMEHKWAIYFHKGQLLFIRSWLREVYAIAEVEQSGEDVRISAVQGAFTYPEEEPDLTIRALNYVVRSHALGVDFPAPLPMGMEAAPESAALWCMSHFGNLALFATPHAIVSEVPEKPLRSYSLLHISVAKGDKVAVDAYLTAGVPVDLLAADGLAPLHWALTVRRRRVPLIGSWARDTVMLQHLLRRGSPVDVRSIEGATPLMNAVQTGSVRQVTFLLDHGANPVAADDRGFTALHRAAEMGKTDMVRILLARGAFPDVEAQGHTPLSLAEGRKHENIVKLLKRR